MPKRKTYCMMRSCENFYGTTDPNENMFRIPTYDEQLYQKWKTEIGKHQPMSVGQGFICRRHFTADDLMDGKRARLQKGAVPSIFNSVRFVDVSAIQKDSSNDVLSNNEEEQEWHKQCLSVNLEQPSLPYPKRCCSIRSCEYFDGTTDPRVLMTLLPQNEERYLKWKNEIEKYETLEHRNGYICRKHFADEDVLPNKKKIVLKKGAVPRIFDSVKFVDVSAIKNEFSNDALSIDEKEMRVQNVHTIPKQQYAKIQKRCCLIKSCEYFDGTTDPAVLMILLPQNEETYLKWKNEIEKYETLEHRNGYICRRHFADEDVLPAKNKIVLRKGAVPRIFNSLKIVDLSSIKAEAFNENEVTVPEGEESNMSYEGDDAPNVACADDRNMLCETCPKSEWETKYLKNKITAMKAKYEDEIKRITEKKIAMALKLRNRAQKVKNLRSQLSYSEHVQKKLKNLHDGQLSKKARLEHEDESEEDASEDTDVAIDE